MSFKSQGLKITLRPETMQDVGQAALATIREQCEAGVSANGEDLGIDWRKSGQLLNSAGVDDQGAVVFPAPHAEVVNARFPFADIAPQFVEAYHKRLEPVLEAGMIFEKVEE